MVKSKTERRKQPRAKAVGGLTVGAKPHLATVQVKDISAAGLCFKNSRPLEFMSRLQMILVIPLCADALVRPEIGEIHCEGVVVRCERIEDKHGNHYEIAVFFTQMDEAARKAVEKYVKNHA